MFKVADECNGRMMKNFKGSTVREKLAAWYEWFSSVVKVRVEGAWSLWSLFFVSTKLSGCHLRKVKVFLRRGNL